jgi:hypothetical protein
MSECYFLPVMARPSLHGEGEEQEPTGLRSTPAR